MKKIHIVAHSHGGNILIKSLLLLRRTSANEKLGCFIFLGTPFFSYKSVGAPSLVETLLILGSGVWKRAHLHSEEAKRRKGHSEQYSGTFFSIHSKHDEAFHVLRNLIELRNSAYGYSKRWTEKTRLGATPPNSLSARTMMQLRLGKYGIQSIRSAGSRRERDHSVGMKMGYFSQMALLSWLVGFYMLQILLACFSPLLSVAKRWGQRWGTYFGIKSMASAALGDDLAFERIMAVNRVSDVVPTVMVTLNDDLDRVILAKTVAGADELLVRLYRSLSNSSAELEFGAMAGAVSEILAAKQLVHSQYYENEDVVEIIAKAISGRFHAPI